MLSKNCPREKVIKVRLKFLLDSDPLQLSQKRPRTMWCIDYHTILFMSRINQNYNKVLKLKTMTHS